MAVKVPMFCESAFYRATNVVGISTSPAAASDTRAAFRYRALLFRAEIFPKWGREFDNKSMVRRDCEFRHAVDKLWRRTCDASPLHQGAK